MSQRRRNFLSGMVAVAVLGGMWVARDSVAAAEQTVDQTLLNAASVQDTAVPVTAPVVMACQETAIYVEWGTGVTAGAVIIESAFTATYAGTWAPLVTVTFAATAPKVDIVQITGVHGTLRTRISTTVANGTVTTRLICN